MAQRINWVDSAKGIGILCVILGHTQMTEGIRALIYSFHLPLFFLLSGIFLFVRERSWKEELLRKTKGLMVPYLFFNVILILFMFVKETLEYRFGMNQMVQEPSLLIPFKAMFIGDRTHAHLWFLPCLFFAEILLLFFSRFKHQMRWVALLLAFGGCLLNYYVGEPMLMSWDNVLFAASFIAVGIYYRDREIHSASWVYVLVFCVFAGAAYLNLQPTGGFGVDMFDCRYGNYFYFYLAALSAIFLILALVRRFPNSHVLMFFGKNSLLIYCTHRIFLIMMIIIVKRLPLPLSDPDMLSVVRSLLETLGVCLCCVPTVYLVNRYCPWLLGKSMKKQN